MLLSMMTRHGCAAKGVVTAGLLLTLGACESMPFQGEEAPTASPQDAAKATQVSDPIARFATNAPQGATSQVSYEGSSVWVTVGPYYQSAAGNRCRRVTMRAQEGGSHISAVCRADGVWRTVITY